MFWQQILKTFRGEKRSVKEIIICLKGSPKTYVFKNNNFMYIFYPLNLERRWIYILVSVLQTIMVALLWRANFGGEWRKKDRTLAFHEHGPISLCPLIFLLNLPSFISQMSQIPLRKKSCTILLTIGNKPMYLHIFGDSHLKFMWTELERSVSLLCLLQIRLISDLGAYCLHSKAEAPKISTVIILSLKVS